jgi:hypothetical protein
MVPKKTLDKIGAHANVRRVNVSLDYAISGVAINDLAVLALRLNDRMDDGEELRDW